MSRLGSWGVKPPEDLQPNSFRQKKLEASVKLKVKHTCLPTPDLDSQVTFRLLFIPNDKVFFGGDQKTRTLGCKGSCYYLITSLWPQHIHISIKSTADNFRFLFSVLVTVSWGFGLMRATMSYRLLSNASNASKRPWKSGQSKTSDKRQTSSTAKRFKVFTLMGVYHLDCEGGL